MFNPEFDNLKDNYYTLLAAQQAGEISREQFIDAVQLLNTRDSQGNIWAIEANSGQFMVYTEEGWQYRLPPGEVAPRSTLITNPGCRKAMGVLALTLPLVSALVWFVYSSFMPGSEGWDCLTPLIIGGLPLILLIFQKPLDNLLRPLQAIRTLTPKLVLRGAAFALPVVLGIICSQTAGTEYSGLRFSIIISMLGAYVLLRDPEVAQ